MGDWQLIEEKLEQMLNTIFNGYDMDALSSYEKRKIIFEYLTNNLEYDYDLLGKIRDFHVNKNKVTRNSILELYSVMNNKKGICNAISQYYKLLLEKVGIKSHCVICDDSTEVKHQLNLVYDEQTGMYSFDDVTSVIVGRGTTDEYFDYDLGFANSVGQGNKELMSGRKFLILTEEYINYLVNKSSSITKTLDSLPSNLASVKSKQTRKNI